MDLIQRNCIGPAGQSGKGAKRPCCLFFILVFFCLALVLVGLDQPDGKLVKPHHGNGQPELRERIGRGEDGGDSDDTDNGILAPLAKLLGRDDADLAQQVFAVLSLAGDSAGVRDSGYFRAARAHAERLDAATAGRLRLLELVMLIGG